MHYYKDYGAHISLPTSAIVVLGLLEKEDDDEQFFVGGTNTKWTHFGIFGTSQTVLTVSTNAARCYY